MRKILSTFCLILTLAGLLGIAQAQAQVVVSGKVVDNNGEALIGVNIAILGKVVGTISDVNGNFSLSTNTPAPFTLTISSIGYASQTLEVTGSMSNVEIKLEEQSILGQEVIVSASRFEENVLQAPVAVEKMDIIAIRNAPAATFYESLRNLKGVDVAAQSLTFNSPTTRGFAANGNLRMNQLIDGIDNFAPGLNFAAGNIVGISELDLESVELLPGASSALYGPGGMNGTLLMTSKSPFEYQGLSASVRGGVMHFNSPSQNVRPMGEFAARYAKSFNDRFAFKVNVSYLTADDWEATDFRSFVDNGNHNLGIENTTRENDPGYDGINIYGDEIGTNIGPNSSVASGLVQAGLITPEQAQLLPNEVVTRTGYTDEDLVDYDAFSLKLNTALHYRINEDLELIGQVSYGNGTTVYTANNRNAISNFSLTQAKLELKGSNFFLRGWTTLERSGDSYDAGNLGVAINSTWKSDTDWFGEYAGAYLTALAQNGGDVTASHQFARSIADQGRLMPGSPEFNSVSEQLQKTPISQGGALFEDRTNLYHVEGMYNFSKFIKAVDITVGASYRHYRLRSDGTLFDDADGNAIPINEYGIYGQISKSFVNDRIKLQVSGRYDKNENFDGRFTPRGSAVFSLGADRQHNLRFSAQTAFRFPTTQNQFINLQLRPGVVLIGGLPQFLERFDDNPAYSLPNAGAFGAAFGAATEDPEVLNQAVQTIIAGGGDPTDVALVQQTIIGISLNQTVGILEPFEFDEFKVERVFSLETGYRGLIADKLYVDAYVYWSRYNDFVGQRLVVQGASADDPLSVIGLTPGSTVYILPVTFDQPVETLGWGLSLDYQLPKGFQIGANVAYNSIEGIPADAVADGLRVDWNTPRYRTNVSFSNREVVKNLGFGITWRWQDRFNWESGFGSGPIGDFHTVDAQINYKVSSIKTIFKVGAQNMFNSYYTTGIANPSIGGLYYVKVTFDQFLN